MHHHPSLAVLHVHYLHLAFKGELDELEALGSPEELVGSVGVHQKSAWKEGQISDCLV